MRKIFLNTMQKISPENSLPLPRNLNKKRNDSARQWPRLIQIKACLTS